MPISLFDLAYEVPIIEPKVYGERYTSIPFDATDPRRNEPLVRLETVGVAYEAHHARTDGQNWPYFGPVPGARKDVWLRQTVAGMLTNVNDRVKPFGQHPRGPQRFGERGRSGIPSIPAISTTMIRRRGRPMPRARRWTCRC